MENTVPLPGLLKHLSEPSITIKHLPLKKGLNSQHLMTNLSYMTRSTIHPSETVSPNFLR
jgi:hypothetical protein